jgi:hypothetical protein
VRRERWPQPLGSSSQLSSSARSADAVLPWLRRSRLAGAFLDGVNVASWRSWRWSLGIGAHGAYRRANYRHGLRCFGLLFRYRVNAGWLALGGCCGDWRWRRLRACPTSYVDYGRGGVVGGASCRINTFSPGFTSFRRCRISSSPEGLSPKRPMRARCSSIFARLIRVLLLVFANQAAFLHESGNTLRFLATQ